MRINRFYTERKNLRVGSSVKLNPSDIKHIRKVLRLQKGDEILIFNGEKEFRAKLKLVGNEVVMADLIEVVKEGGAESSQIELTLFQCLLRAGKFDFIVEKVSELGVNTIVPVQAEFSQMKLDAAEKKLDRWSRIAISAAKQSGRLRPVDLIPPIHFGAIKEVLNEFDKIYLFTVPKAVESKRVSIKSLKEVIDKTARNVAFVIGPEGGFSPSELTLAAEWGIEFVSFGPTILRSETSALAIASVLRYEYGAMN